MAGEPLDYPIGNQQADSASQIIQIDSGKHVAVVALCAAICGMSVVFAWRASTLATEATTEYRVLLNHVMELEAAQKAMEKHHE